MYTLRIVFAIHRDLYAMRGNRLQSMSIANRKFAWTRHATIFSFNRRYVIAVKKKKKKKWKYRQNIDGSPWYFPIDCFMSIECYSPWSFEDWIQTKSTNEKGIWETFFIRGRATPVEYFSAFVRWLLQVELIYKPRIIEQCKREWHWFDNTLLSLPLNRTVYLYVKFWYKIVDHQWHIEDISGPPIPSFFQQYSYISRSSLTTHSSQN